jgi:hypothetical protein
MKHRRRWPKILLGTIAFVLIVSAAFGGFVWWKTAPPPTIDTVAALIKAREALQPEGEDAWPRYVALLRDTLGMEHFNDWHASDLSRLFFSIGTSEIATITTSEWDDPRLDDAKAMLREAQPIVEALRYATDAPACRAPILSVTLHSGLQIAPLDSRDETSGSPLDDYSAIGGVQFAYFLRFLGLFQLEAREAFEVGDLERCTDTIRRMFTLCEHNGAAPFDTAQMSQSETEKLVYRFIRLLALDGQMPPDWVDAMIEIIDDPARAMPLRDFLLSTAEVSANTDMRHYAREMRAPSELLETVLGAWSSPSPREFALRRAESVRETAAIVDVPTAELASRGLSRDLFISHSDPRVRRVTRYREIALSARAATRIILLLERHHALTGEWPASLEDIMPRGETLDPNTLTPFVYTRTPDGHLPFSLLAPPEADFIREEDRDFTKPRVPIAVQNNGGPPPS